MSKLMHGILSLTPWTSAAGVAWGGGPSPSWAFWSFDQSICLPPLSPIPDCLSLPFKFFFSLPLSHSASDDDAQSGIRKFRQNCSFLLFCTVISIMKLQVVFSIILPVLAMTIRLKIMIQFKISITMESFSLVWTPKMTE